MPEYVYVSVFLAGFIAGMLLILWRFESGRGSIDKFEHWKRRAEWRQSIPKEPPAPASAKEGKG